MLSTPVRSVSVVIPVFNEVDSLSLLKAELDVVVAKYSQISWEFIFVDDGSKDGSHDILRKLASSDSRVRVISFTRNFGQTAALSCGIQQATGDVILPMDADLQNDPADIPQFLNKINEGYDCVSGWRRERQDAFLSRRLPSQLANGLISWFTGVELHDYGCTLKAYRRELIQGVALYGEMHRFIPAYAAWSGGRVTEIVTHHRARQHGVSKYGLSRVPKVMLDLLVVQFLIRYFDRPMHIFGGIGILSLVLGGLCEVIAIYLKLAGLKSLVDTPLPIVGAMFIVVGVQLVMTGLLAEVLMRTYYESRHSAPYIVKE